jgi:hypothetical protein
MDARTTALGFDEGESGRSAGHRQKGCETQAVTAEIMSAGDGLMRGGGCYVRGMAIGMRHRPELGKHQRDSGDYRKAKLETM